MRLAERTRLIEVKRSLVGIVVKLIELTSQKNSRGSSNLKE